MKKNKLILFFFSFAAFFCCQNTYALTLTEPDLSFGSFLDLLSEVCSMFLKYFILFCNSLLSNYFILCILGIVLFISSINLIFEIISLFRVSPEYLQDSIEKRLAEKHDFEVKTYELARKELVMRQNYEYNLQKDTFDSARKELIMRQNRLQVFDPNLNSIKNLTDKNFVSNLNIRNFKGYNYGSLSRNYLDYRVVSSKGNSYIVTDTKNVNQYGHNVDSFSSRSYSPILGVGDKIIESDRYLKDHPKRTITEEEKRELDELLKPFE